MINNKTRGADRERGLGRSEYFSNSYFTLPVLFSQMMQTRMIHELKLKSVLEIGTANGFVSDFLRKSGLEITTADINADLLPDICAPLSELPSMVDRKFDCIMCCEVLEHMPLEDLDFNLDVLRSLGDRLFMTLPNSFANFGFGCVAKLPRVRPFLLGLHLNLPKKKKLEGTPHFWEVGYSRECSRGNIVRRLKQRYKRVTHKRLAMNPDHYYFRAG